MSDGYSIPEPRHTLRITIGICLTPDLQDRVITVADGTDYPVQCEGELILKSICGAVLTLNSVLYVPEAKNVLSGSRLVQGKGHRVEIDSIGTRLVCNTGTRPYVTHELRRR